MSLTFWLSEVKALKKDFKYLANCRDNFCWIIWDNESTRIDC